MAIGTPQPIQNQPQQLNNSVQETVEEQPQVVDQAQEIMPEPAWDDLTTAQKIEQNPNNCDLTTQVMWDDGTCHDKPKQAAVPTPRPVAQGGCEAYRSLVAQYDWNVNIAMAVMRAESGCNPNAANLRDRHANCTGSFGLFQLACFWTSTPYDPAHNVAKAYEIYSRSGWKPWGAYTNGSYKKYL